MDEIESIGEREDPDPNLIWIFFFLLSSVLHNALIPGCQSNLHNLPPFSMAAAIVFTFRPNNSFSSQVFSPWETNYVNEVRCKDSKIWFVSGNIKSHYGFLLFMVFW